jgi:thymidylate kinase
MAHSVNDGIISMQFSDDTPPPGVIPEIYPRNPPINLLNGPALLRPDNFFAVEGIDGAGKSSLIAEILRIRSAIGAATHVLKLGRSEVTAHALERAKWTNSNPMTFSLLNWVSVYEQVTAARNVFNTDTLMLFDRYVLTIKVRGLLEGLSTDFMDLIERQLPRPRKLFFIDCDPEICCQRILAGRHGVSYFEAGSRIVAGFSDPMIEHDPKARRSDAARIDGLLRHLIRMRDGLHQLAQRYDNVVAVENSGPPQRAVEAILKELKAESGSTHSQPD